MSRSQLHLTSSFLSSVFRRRMAATTVRALRPHKEFTHTLSIPLDSSSFLSQLQTSLQPFRKKASAIIPETAFLPPHLYRLRVGRLHLNTAPRLEEFLKVMHGLKHLNVELSDMTRSVSHLAPLTIDVSGLITRSPDPSAATHLNLPVVDPTYRFQPFLQALTGYFSAAGFPLLRPPGIDTIHIVDTIMISWREPSRRIVLPNGKRGIQRGPDHLPTFNATELLKVNENTIWAREVPLERISLDGIGITERNSEGDKVFRSRPEVDSVALPQRMGNGKLSTR